MEFFAITSRNPAAFLAWDDAFLEETRETGREFLWFWESPVPFVVVGYGQSISDTVDEPACSVAGVPILRRRSGGGTVLQGPGCLSYGLSLRSDRDPELQSITSTNERIMERHASALAIRLGRPVLKRGHTDLALEAVRGTLKFSGNAQRRSGNSILFHGTFLHGFPLESIEVLLKLPEDQPEYRARRSHRDFLTHLPLPPEVIRETIREAWQAQPSPNPPPTPRQEQSLQERYSLPEWHQRRQIHAPP